MVINIISLNVRGLRDQIKRRAIFDMYRPKCDILCLQETHSEEQDEKYWSAEWGGRCIFAHGTTQARGTAILFKKSACVDIETKLTSEDGRSCQCIFVNNDVRIHLINVYGPNVDSPTFFVNLVKQLQENTDKAILIGDFNTALDPRLDTKSGWHQNKKSREVLLELTDKQVLMDIWRSRNADVKRFSWYKKSSEEMITASRIDFALISTGIADYVHNTFYLNGL